MTIASMIASELKRICRSAAAMGPFGSRTPSEQPATAAAAIKAAANAASRMSDLLCPGNVSREHRQRQRIARGLQPVGTALAIAHILTVLSRIEKKSVRPHC